MMSAATSRLDFGGGSEADHEDNDGMLDPEDDFEREDQEERDRRQRQQQERDDLAEQQEEDEDDEDEQCEERPTFLTSEKVFIIIVFFLSDDSVPSTITSSQVLPWGAPKERSRFPSSVNIDTDIKPGEFVMRTLIAEFTIQVEKKISAIMVEPLERPLSKSLQRGKIKM